METIKNIISGVTQTLSAPPEDAAVENKAVAVEEPKKEELSQEGNPGIVGRLVNAVKDAFVAPDIGGSPLVTERLSTEASKPAEDVKAPKLTVTEATPQPERKPEEVDNKGMVQQGVDMAKDAAAKVIHKVEETFPNASEKAKEMGSAAMEAVSNTYHRGLEASQEAATNLKEKAEEKFPNATERVKEASAATANAAVQAAGSIKESIGLASDKQSPVSAATEAKFNAAKEPEDAKEEKKELKTEEPIAAMYFEKIKEMKEESQHPAEAAPAAPKNAHITPDQLLKLIDQAQKQMPSDLDKKLPKLTEDIAFGHSLHPSIEAHHEKPQEYPNRHRANEVGHPLGDERPIQQPNRSG